MPDDVVMFLMWRLVVLLAVLGVLAYVSSQVGRVIFDEEPQNKFLNDISKKLKTFRNRWLP